MPHLMATGLARLAACGASVALLVACESDPAPSSSTTTSAPPETTDPPCPASQDGLALPAPTGPYCVGTSARRLVDSTRGEPATPDTDDRRSVVMQAWYPAPADAGGELAPWISPAVGEAFAKGTPMPPTWAASVRTHAQRDVPIRADAGPFPVVLASHGLSTPSRMYTSYYEELASHGYVVIALEHPHDVVLTVFPDDGSAAGFDSAAAQAQTALPAEPTLDEQQAFWAMLDGYIGLWIADARFTLDELERLQDDDPEGLLTGHLDLGRIGMLGHSFGGATAAEVCWADARVDACINLDGAFVGPARLGGGRAMSKPFLTMLAYDHSADDPSPQELFEKQTGPAYQVVVDGLAHVGFSDLGYVLRGLYGDLPTFASLVGPMDGARAIRVVRAYTRALFDEHLRGEASPLLEGPSPDFPEADVTVK